MDDRTDLGRIRLQARTNDPSHLPMCFYAATDESGPRRENKIPVQAFPDEMEFVVVPPHVSAGTGDRVLRFRVIVYTRTRMIDLPHIGLPVEQAQRLLLRSGMTGR